ncbi:hypothetical protein K7X08_029045 [Anisodus acutangulus]|uniref:Uncharacterized protein n=1 Tax=Anisodus acutangulus TaxID=402998 RepID=A0A9Q1L3J3_9SOLA|nr:hypothetical protein K7X08_029045 [Anisodus acutangulus]
MNDVVKFDLHSQEDLQAFPEDMLCKATSTAKESTPILHILCDVVVSTPNDSWKAYRKKYCRDVGNVEEPIMLSYFANDRFPQFNIVKDMLLSKEYYTKFLKKTCDAKLDRILDNQKNEKECMDRLIAALQKSGLNFQTKSVDGVNDVSEDPDHVIVCSPVEQCRKRKERSVSRCPIVQKKNALQSTGVPADTDMEHEEGEFVQREERIEAHSVTSDPIEATIKATATEKLSEQLHSFIRDEREVLNQMVCQLMLKWHLNKLPSKKFISIGNEDEEFYPAQFNILQEELNFEDDDIFYLSDIIMGKKASICRGRMLIRD